jgi:ribosomal protein S3
MEAARIALAASAIDAHAPGVDVERLDIDGGHGVVTVWTRHPGLLIGRRGTTADSIRLSLGEALGLESVKLLILEVRDEPPEQPEGGVREPRRPWPSAPSTGQTFDVRQ